MIYGNPTGNTILDQIETWGKGNWWILHDPQIPRVSLSDTLNLGIKAINEYSMILKFPEPHYQIQWTL